MEPRNYESGASESAPIAPETPSVGYPTGGNPGTGTPATKPGAFWFHKIGESLRRVIVSAGLSPSDENLDLLDQAISTKIKTLIIGEGQSRLNVTASRSAGVEYTNSTGRTRVAQVEIISSNSSGTGSYSIIVGGVTSGNTWTSTTWRNTVTLIIKPGESYQINVTGVGAVGDWVELG